MVPIHPTPALPIYVNQAKKEVRTEMKIQLPSGGKKIIGS
jgi:hypothetical protein